MGMLRKFFYRKPPDGLFEISEKVYVFDCCFTTDILKDDEYNVYIGGIIIQLREHFPGASFMVFNFREGDNQSQISTILSHYDMIVMDYPRQYETVPLLTMEMIHHFLRSSESWLSLAPQNILLMHCERGGWPVLAFMLAALLIYRKQYTGELKTLDMIYKQAPRELLQLISPMNPLPSQLRYLQYISRRNVGSVWPPVDRVLTLDCIIIRVIPNSDGEGGFRPMFRIYGQDPFVASDRSPKVVFSTPKRSKAVRHYKQIDCELVKVDIHCIVKGDVLLECVSLDKDLEHEKMMFRIMFNTAFIRSNILMLNRDEIDVLWDSKDQFPKDFRAEVLFTEMNNLTSRTSVDIPALEDKEGLPMEAFAKVREIFSSFDWLDPKSDVALSVLQQISATNPISETLEAMPSLSVDTTCLRQILSAEKADQREKTEASENTNSSNSVRGKVEPQELLVTLETPTKSEIISPRIPHSPQCHPISSGNFLQGSPVSIARYNSAPSSMGITTLLHDHAVNDNVEVTHKIIKSSSPVSHVSKLGLVQIPPPSVRPPPVASFSIASTSIESSYSPPPPPPPPRPQTHFYESPPPPPPISRSSFADTVKNSVLPPPPPPLPSSLSRSHVVPIVERSMLTPPPPPLPRSTTTMCPSSLDMERKTSIAPPPPPPPKGVVSKASQQAPPVPPPPTTFSTSSGGCSPKSHTCSNWNVPPTPLSASNAKGPTQLRTSSRNHGQGKRTSLKPYHWLKLSRAMQGSLWAEAQKSDEASKPPEFDMSELENLFSAATPSSGLGSIRGKSNHSASGRKSDKVQVIDLRRAYNCEIMLTKVKIPLPDLMSSVLALDESALDVDQVDNLVKFCPTKEETELLKGFKGDQENLGKCEQFFLELMKVPRVESKLRVFSFKIQFRTQVSDLRHSLNVVNSAAEEIKGSVKLKRIMQTILSLGNALNHGTARGSAVGFRLDSLLKLTDTKARNNKMTLMHYLCKVLAEKLPELLDFAKDLVHLEASERIQLKLLAEEMQAISKGLEKVVQELTASENDGPVSVKFCKILKEFLGFAEGEVRSLASLYSGVGRNADALAYYFGEDPARCPFEQVVSTLLNFVRMFVRAHGENCKQIELEKKKAQKEAESEKTKTAACKKESANPTEVEKKKAHEKMKGTSAASKEPARLPT